LLTVSDLIQVLGLCQLVFSFGILFLNIQFHLTLSDSSKQFYVTQSNWTFKILNIGNEYFAQGSKTLDG